jgi:hypothetical protein
MNSNIINSLWIGNTLSNVELLTMKSFIAHGHTFRLWIYNNELKNVLPPEVIAADANEIIPEKEVFSYKQQNKFGHGKGSFAGFSDIFRYRLLYLHGGWWVDMDITCLKKFDFEAEYFFRSHHELPLVGNVMKCPKESELMKICYEEGVANVNESNTDWHKPIEILCSNVQKLQLNNFIKEGLSNHDVWEETNSFISRKTAIPSGYYFLHWQNEEWRAKLLDKDCVRINSTLGGLMQQHGILKPQYSARELLHNTFQQTGFYKNMKLLGIV